MRNTSIGNATSKCECNYWNISGNCGTYLIHEMRRTISNHSQNIKRLDLNYGKVQKEISKWKRNEKSQKLELSQLKQNIEQLKEQVKEQNIEIGKLRKNLDKESKAGPDKVVPTGTTRTRTTATTASRRKYSTVVRKAVETFQWEIDNFKSIRRKKEDMLSPKLLSKDLVYTVQFWLSTSLPNLIKITLIMYETRYDRDPPKAKGVAKMTIYDAKNLKLYHSTKEDFRPSSDGRIRQDFFFNYRDLDKAKVFKKNKVLIECAVEIRSGRKLPIPPISKRDHTYQWRFDNFTSIRNKGKTVSELEKGNRKLLFFAELVLVTRDQSIVIVKIDLRPRDFRKMPPNVEGEATMTIYNAENLKFYKTIKLKIKADDNDRIFKSFYFRFDELEEARVLQSDKIIIKCVLQIPPASKGLGKESKAGSDKIQVVPTATESPIKPSTSSRKPVETVQWKVDNFESTRGEGKTIFSSDMKNNKLRYDFRFRLITGYPSLVIVGLNMSQMPSNKSMPPNVERLATMTIYNAENLKFHKTVKLKIKADDNERIFKSFYFHFDELEEARVLQSDKIIIECAVEVLSEREILDKESKAGSDKVVPTATTTTTTEMPNKASTAVSKPVETFHWKVNNFESIRRERSYFRAPIFNSKDLMYKVSLNLETKVPSFVVVGLGVFPLYDHLDPSKYEEVATITIYNGRDLKCYKTMKLKIKGAYDKTIYKSFYFNYDELVAAKVLQSDEILIKCSLVIPPR